MHQEILDHLHSQVSPTYYHSGIRRNPFQWYWHTQRVRAFASLLPTCGGTYVDLGCHGGFITEEISKIIRAQKVIGIDISPEAIAFFCKQHPTWQGILQGIEDSLPIADGAASCITCIDVMEHVMHPEQVAKEAARISGPGAYMLVAVPRENLLWKLIWPIWTHIGPGRAWHDVHVQDYLRSGLHPLFTQAGFSIEKEKIMHFGMYLITLYRYGGR